MGESPTKTSESGGGEDHDRSRDRDGCRVVGHEEDSGGDETDDSNETKRVDFQAEGEGKNEDEDEGLGGVRVKSGRVSSRDSTREDRAAHG